MTLNWLDPEFDVVFSELLFLYVIGLLILTIGFYRALYFISTGYALSITAMAVITPLRHLDNLTVISALQNILLLVWSLRLSVYLIRREFRTSYRKRNAETHKTFSRIPLGFNLLIWVGVSFLYVLMFSPSLFQLSGHPAPTSWISYLVPIAGLVFMLSGLVLEAVADQQKSKFKAQFPGQFCNTGIYLWVRSPNYLGEILFWIGNWITSLNPIEMDCQYIWDGDNPCDHDGIYQKVGSRPGRTVWGSTRIPGIHPYGAGPVPFCTGLQSEKCARNFRVKAPIKAV